MSDVKAWKRAWEEAKASLSMAALPKRKECM